MLPDVFLISIDCLRPDYLGTYDAARPCSPNIDALSDGAAVFTQAVSHAPFTTPAVACLLSGAYPFRTGVRLLLGQICEPSIATIAAHARRAGYVTGGFPSNFILNSGTGLGRGFDVYRDITDGIDGGRGGCWQTGDRLNNAIDGFLAEAGTRRVFCWVHYFDLHDYHLDATVPIETSYPRDLRDKIDRDCIGGLLDLLDKHGRRDDAAIILTADHGECLFQHGHRGHGQHVYDSVIRVPLIWRWGGVTRSSQRIDTQARHVDIFPTLLDLWGVPASDWPRHLDGRSLLPLMRGETLPSAPSYAEASPEQLFKGDITAMKGFRGPEIRALRDERYKFIRHDDGRTEFYDLKADPGERQDVSLSQQDEVARYADLLARLCEADTGRFACASIAPDAKQTVMQRLRDLGYVA